MSDEQTGPAETKVPSMVGLNETRWVDTVTLAATTMVSRRTLVVENSETSEVAVDRSVAKAGFGAGGPAQRKMLEGDVKVGLFTWKCRVTTRGVRLTFMCLPSYISYTADYIRGVTAGPR